MNAYMACCCEGEKTPCGEAVCNYGEGLFICGSYSVAFEKEFVDLNERSACCDLFPLDVSYNYSNDEIKFNGYYRVSFKAILKRSNDTSLFQASSSNPASFIKFYIQAAGIGVKNEDGISDTNQCGENSVSERESHTTFEFEFGQQEEVTDGLVAITVDVNQRDCVFGDETSNPCFNFFDFGDCLSTLRIYFSGKKLGEASRTNTVVEYSFGELVTDVNESETAEFVGSFNWDGRFYRLAELDELCERTRTSVLYNLHFPYYWTCQEILGGECRVCADPPDTCSPQNPFSEIQPYHGISLGLGPGVGNPTWLDSLIAAINYTDIFPCSMVSTGNGNYNTASSLFSITDNYPCPGNGPCTTVDEISDEESYERVRHKTNNLTLSHNLEISKWEIIPASEMPLNGNDNWDQLPRFACNV